MSRPPALDEEQWERLVKFYHAGHTMKECGVRFGVSEATVQRYFKKHPDIPRRKAFQPSRDKSVKKKRILPDAMPPGGSSPTPRIIVSLKE